MSVGELSGDLSVDSGAWQPSLGQPLQTGQGGPGAGEGSCWRCVPEAQ